MHSIGWIELEYGRCIRFIHRSFSQPVGGGAAEGLTCLGSAAGADVGRDAATRLLVPLLVLLCPPLVPSTARRCRRTYLSPDSNRMEVWSSRGLAAPGPEHSLPPAGCIDATSKGTRGMAQQGSE